MADKEKPEGCAVACVQMENLTKRVDKMDVHVGEITNKVNSIDSKVAAMGERDNFLEKLMGKLDGSLGEIKDAYKENTKVISQMRETMVGMQGEIKSNAVVTQEIKEELGGLRKKFDDSEEKSKLDIRVILKKVIENKLSWVIGFLLSLAGVLDALGFDVDKFTELLNKK